MKANNILRQELRQAGAKPSEVAGLLDVAHQLQGLGKARQRQVPWWQRHHYAIPVFAATFAIIIALVIFAQGSLPGSWAYPVKRASEQAAVLVDHNYRATLMVRRSQEVKDLVANRASQDKVFATLAAYRSEAAAYDSPTYSTLEHCKANLEQSARIASDAERPAIQSTIAAIPT